MKTIPSLYRPTVPEDFIGPARVAAQTILRLAQNVSMSGAPLKLMLLGPPGTGKSALADFLTAQLGCGKWSVHKFNGTQLKIEQVEDLARSLRYTDLFGGYRLVRIEEVDKVPTVAQVNLLTVLDDLPDRTAVVCTSNCKVDVLEERYQTRFIVLDVRGPTQDELKTFLQTNWPTLPPAEVTKIATFACGNVRAALLDAELALAA